MSTNCALTRKLPCLFTLVLLMCVTMPVRSAEEMVGDVDGDGVRDSLADVAQQINNPVGDLWMMFMQNDMTIYDGDLTEGDRLWNSFKFQPVTPFLLTENIRLINRPVIQLNSFETPSLGASGLEWDRDWGLGDTILLQVLAPADMGENVYGFGLTHIFPTATDDNLGSEKWAAGPAALMFHLGEKWILGGVFQHWWDYAGEDNRPDVNLTDFQYVIRYKLNPLFQIGTGPNIQYNWETNDLSLPIGFGMDSTTLVGRMPFRWGFDLEYYLVQSDEFGPQWNMRLFFIPVISAPGWATKPLFGG